MERYWFSSLFRSPFGRMLTAILFVFTLIPVLAVFIFGTVAINEQLQNRSLAQLQTLRDLNQSALDQWTTEAYNALQATLENPVVIQNSLFMFQAAGASRSAEVLAQDLSGLVDTGYFRNVYLVRPDDSLVLSTAADLEIESLGIGIDALEQNGEHFWGFAEAPALGYSTAFAWRPIQDRRLTTVGYLVGEFNQETIAAMVAESSVTVGETASTHIINAEGVELIPNNDTRWTTPAINDTVVLSTAYTGMFTEPGGASVVGTIQALTAPLQAWIVTVQHESEITRPLRDVAPIAIGFGIALTVLAILAAFPTTQRIINPLQNLQKAAQEMAGGNLKTHVDIQRKDEFGSLATSFNYMADELQTAFESLESINAALEHRADQLATITRVGQLATQFLGLDDLLATVTREIYDVFNYQVIVIYLLDDETQKLVARAAAGDVSEMVIGNLSWSLDASSPIGIAATERRTVVGAPSAPPHLSALHPDIQSEVNIPLLLGAQESQLIGMFSIQSAQQNAFSSEDVEVLQIFARQLAIAIRNAELFDESEHARYLADLANQQKSEFLSNMSHELRTPLNVIIGYSHSILNRPAMYQNVPLPGEYAQSVESIMTSGQHLLGLINDILDLSKIEAGRIDLSIEPIDPLPLLTGVRATALGLVKEGVNVYTSFSDKLPRIFGDEVRVRQILLNLVSNAAKFTEQGSVTIGARTQGANLLFWVADTGFGIPEDAQKDLFQRFQQAHRIETRIHGTGLGLSISRELTRLQGGEIWLNSKVGEGTTFYFTIPLAETGVNITTPTAPVREASGRVSVFEPEPDSAVTMRQILLVDPRSDTRKELYDGLSARNYDVLAESVADDVIPLALALLPNALVLHIQDESDDMEQLANRLREEAALSDIPLLLLRDTGLTGSADADESIIEQISARISDSIDAKTSVGM